MNRCWLAVPCLLLAFVLVGCGGDSAIGPAPGPDSDAGMQQIGPFVIRTAATAGFRAQNIPNQSGAAFVALSGAKVTYLGVQEMLDRIVYMRDGAETWACGLFGANQALVADWALDPAWSPDGTRLAVRSDGYCIVVMDPDGANATALTTSNTDLLPTWSPDGLMIAFVTDIGGDCEIYRMNLDGTDVENLSRHGSPDFDPAWAADGSGIYFESERDGDLEIYRMDEYGGSITRLTYDSRADLMPCVSPDGTRLAWKREEPAGTSSILIAAAGGSSPRKLTSGPWDYAPCFSSDGTLLAFSRWDGSQTDLWLKEVDPPYREYQITDTPSVLEESPDLGSPIPQIRRVIIGADGSDHGYDPLWPYCYAAVLAFDDSGYLSFLRIGVPTSDCDTIEVTPIPDTGDRLVGLRVQADNILNLREDQGIGQEPSWWNIVAESPSAVLLYLDAQTGRLVSALLTRDTVYPAGGAPVAQTVDGNTLRVSGDIAAVYANGGELVAEDVGAVEFDDARLVRTF